MSATVARRLAAASLVALLAACAGDDAPTSLHPSDAPSAARKAKVPNAPVSVTATAGDAQATVQWGVPSSDGGSAILRYTVTSTPGGKVVTVNAPTLTTTVAGLTNGTSYKFTVTATNDVGTSVASTASNAVTPSAPVPPPPPPPAGARWVSGYYVGYQRSLYPESTIDFSKLTHIIVGRITPKPDGTLGTTFDIDATNGPIMARNVSQRAHAAGRKAILMLGGAGEHDNFVGAASSTNRAKFVANLIAAMDSYGYDGLDVDWEPINTADRAPFVALLQDLRAARPGILLTMPVGWVNTNFVSIDAWYTQVAPLVDQMNLMTYDMAGTWDGWQSWHFAALYDHQPNHPSSIAGSIAQYRNAGVPAAKLGIGVGFFGSCWRGLTGPRQTVGTGVFTQPSDNAMSYANIMASYYNAAARKWDDVAKATYLSFASPTGPQGCQFIGYEDAQSIAAKSDFVKAQGLGGAIVWTINEGHLLSAPTGSQDPLLTALYGGLVP